MKTTNNSSLLSLSLSLSSSLLLGNDSCSNDEGIEGI